LRHWSSKYWWLLGGIHQGLSNTSFSKGWSHEDKGDFDPKANYGDNYATAKNKPMRWGEFYWPFYFIACFKSTIKNYQKNWRRCVGQDCSHFGTNYSYGKLYRKEKFLQREFKMLKNTFHSTAPNSMKQSKEKKDNVPSWLRFICYIIL